MIYKHRFFLPALVTLLLFLILLPLVLKINFPQNDDWVYYNMVASFMRGNFVLDAISAPTFYLQGVLGAGFAFLFGTQRLPVLTLLVSCLNFFVFTLLVKNIYKNDNLTPVLFGLILFFNPIHVYSILGFMTENYFLLLTTLTLYLIQKNSNPILVNGYIVLTFFIRQLAFVSSIALGIHLLLKKQWKRGFGQLLCFVGLFFFYMFVFPKTPEMLSKPLEFKNLLEFSYSYSLIYAIILYVCAFTFPVILIFILIWFSTNLPRRPITMILVVVVVATSYVLLNKFFEPHRLAWGEFFYLDNTLERKGFFPRGIDGNKYYFRYIFVLYKYWEIISKITAAFFITSLIFFKKKLNNIYLIYILIYVGVMLVTVKVYDRYLLVLVEMALLYFASSVSNFNLKSKALLASFVLFLAIYSYQFSMDFILLNSYVWNKSVELSTTQHVDKRDIMATNSWKLLNYNPTHTYKYIFTFDSFKTKPELKCCWNVVEEKIINFPLSLFIDPKIYLYKSTTL